ncbi:hypothetical protein ACFFSW_07685 [Saccharothrix longispora]|uniref:Uncharacterized protein n=1 Tax=Saccharothrix longispora TaxID=33920 RepID=A0ABU1PPG4_9PSEU|nr:hypothetical protein [Saccharothrix longispora]MDR6591764.1 hypothetical protein [Saccharothrix longispora]
MTEDEIRLLLDELEELLMSLDLDFVVTQERVLAAEGVSKAGAELGERAEGEVFDFGVSAPLSSDGPWRQPALPLETEKRSTKKVRFTNEDVRVTPLDVRERLANLLDLIEVATAGTLAMERSVYDQIAALRGQAASGSAQQWEDGVNPSRATDWAELWDGTIVFADPPEAELRGTSQESWTLAIGSDFRASTEHAANVVALVESLREQAGVSRGGWLTRGVADGVEDVWAPTKGTS